MAKGNIARMISKEMIPWRVVELLNVNDVITNSARKILRLDKFRMTCVQIHITNLCNLNCKYCYAKNHKGDVLSEEKLLSLVKESAENGVHEIQFVGGEPFMYPYFKKLIRHTVRLGMRIRIYTNTTQIDDEWIEFLQHYKKKIILMAKFDSHSGFQYHVGKDIYAETIGTIKKCISSGLNVNTFISVTKKNVEQVEDLIKSSFDMEANPIVERYLPACSASMNEELEITPVQWREVLSIYNRYNKRYLAEYRLTAKMLNFYCSCYNSTISIDTNGEALPCPYAPKDLSIGNVNEKSLAELFSIYAHKIKEWNRIPDECTSCTNVKLCKGGCKTYAFMKDKGLDKKDSLCTGSPPNITMCSFNKPKL